MIPLDHLPFADKFSAFKRTLLAMDDLSRFQYAVAASFVLHAIVEPVGDLGKSFFRNSGAKFYQHFRAREGCCRVPVQSALISVLVEGARSAEPPMSDGTSLATTC